MTSFDHINGAAVALAVVCAFGVPGKQRKAMVVLVAFFALNWLHYVHSYDPRPPVAVLWDLGIPVRSYAVWALLDAFLASLGLLVWLDDRGSWWGAAIYVLAVTQVLMHGFYWDLQWLPQGIYYAGLDKLFLAQVAVFVLAGGGGIVARIGRFFDLRGHVRRPRPSTFFKSR